MFTMRTATPLVLSLLPLLTAAQSTTVSQAIVPFSSLPACAQLCGPLFDAQGACAPTGATSSSQSCFCSYTTLASFKSGGGTTAVCPSSQCNAADSATIQTWFTNYCAGSSSGGTATTSTGTAATSQAGSSGSTGSTGSSNSGSSSSSGGGGGTWISTHYKYVIMIVVILIGLGLIWWAVSFLQRRHNRKRELQYELRPPAAPWGPNDSHNFGPSPPPAMSQNPSVTSLMSGAIPAGNERSASPGFYAGKGRSPLSREVPTAGQPVTDLEAMNEKQYQPKRTSKLSKWTPGQRT